jgi:hypothetical protein
MPWPRGCDRNNVVLVLNLGLKVLPASISLWATWEIAWASVLDAEVHMAQLPQFLQLTATPTQEEEQHS